VRRSHRGIAVVASAILLAGCTTSGTDGPGDPSPSESTPAAPDIERRALVPYPEAPRPGWTFSAQDSGVTADGELTFVDPTTIVPTIEGYFPPAPIDAGDTIVMAVSDAGPATLVGIDADSGTAEWTYAPASGQLENCARDIIGAAVACAVTDPTNRTDAGVVLIDPETGQELGEVDLPGAPIGLAVGADLVVALTTDADMTPEGEPDPLALTAFDAAGEQRWSTPVVYTPSLGRGPSMNLGVGESLTALEFTGSVYVLRTDDGELVAQRDIGLTDAGHGRNWAWAPLGAAVLLDDDDDNGPSPVVVGADGTELAAFDGYALLSPVLDEVNTAFLRAPDGQIVTIDPTTGEIDGTGVTPAGDGARSASALDNLLLVQADTLLGYDLGNPGQPTWERESTLAVEFIDALPDGSRLYADGLAADENASDGALVLSALDLADGSLTWTFTVEPENGLPDLPTVARGGGRLLVMSGSTITALEP
jgi:outer membrane protein assembly factor BamB